MFFFNKKPASHSDLAWLGADMHSHLIPGIDDGAPDLAASLELVKGFAALGYQKVITTPHILWELYPNTPEIITHGLGELRAAIVDEGIDIEIGAAAEYFIDEHFAADLQQKKPLLTLADNLVLVEISTVTAPFDFKEILFEMQLQNYVPVIAHPERYIYLKDNKSIFSDLKDSGCLLQCNLLSLTGHYGTSVQNLAEYLVKEELYDFVGSDLHHARHLEMIPRAASSPLLARLKASGQLKNGTL
jgi:protein-tyrosine phosphatase